MARADLLSPSSRSHVSKWHKADVRHHSTDVRFFNRPIGVKRFQAVQRYSVDVARGLSGVKRTCRSLRSALVGILRDTSINISRCTVN